MECSEIESYRTIAVICFSVGWNQSKFIHWHQGSESSISNTLQRQNRPSLAYSFSWRTVSVTGHCCNNISSSVTDVIDAYLNFTDSHVYNL